MKVEKWYGVVFLLYSLFIQDGSQSYHILKSEPLIERTNLPAECKQPH